MKTILLSFFCALFVLPSCNKSGGINITGGGKGGKATLLIRADHGGTLIYLDSGIAYIKYGATVPPANGIYDDSAKFTRLHPSDTISTAVFDSLTIGQYYVYAYGVHIGYPQPDLNTKIQRPIDKEDTTIWNGQFSTY